MDKRAVDTVNTRCVRAGWQCLLFALPALKDALLDASFDAVDAYATMSKETLDSERVRDGLKDIQPGPAQLYEALRERSGSSPVCQLVEHLINIFHQGSALSIFVGLSRWVVRLSPALPTAHARESLPLSLATRIVTGMEPPRPPASTRPPGR